MSTKCGKTIETTTIEWTSRRRMFFAIWQFVLTFDYRLFSMHLVYNQFGILRHYPQYELIRRQCIFELCKYSILLKFKLSQSVSKLRSFRRSKNCQRLRMCKERNLMLKDISKFICIWTKSWCCCFHIMLLWISVCWCFWNVLFFL